MLIVNGAAPSLAVTDHRAAMPVCNPFTNLVPCDSEFYFYPALNHRESICCQSGCHHVKRGAARAARCPAAQIRTNALIDRTP